MIPMQKAPSLFVSHGAPTFALEESALVDKLAALGKRLNNIKAVLVVSPHWQTNKLEVMATALPETIHDFYGFPSELYALQYPVQGSPDLASEATALLKMSGLDCEINVSRGLDHGAWVPLMHLFPNANVPAFQVSLPLTATPQSAYALGQALAPLKAKGVLILGTGGITHNLGHFMRHDVDLSYVAQFGDWVRKAIMENRVEDLLNYRRLAPNALQAHPTDEHFLPLFVALGSHAPDEMLEVINGGVSYDILCMDSYLWQMPA